MKNYIEKTKGRIDEITLNLLLNEMESVDVFKDQFLLEEGQYCKTLWFLKSGAIKVYEIINGEIRNSHFVIAECFVTNYVSVVTQKPSDLFFQAVENCQLLKINYAVLEKLYE